MQSEGCEGKASAKPRTAGGNLRRRSGKVGLGVLALSLGEMIRAGLGRAGLDGGLVGVAIVAKHPGAITWSSPSCLDAPTFSGEYCFKMVTPCALRALWGTQGLDGWIAVQKTGFYCWKALVTTRSTSHEQGLHSTPFLVCSSHSKSTPRTTLCP
jgi:hypothetical protein